MDAAPGATMDREPGADAGSASLRRCLATGVLRPREELIRFVADPEGRIVPDLARNLPGRGLWVSPDPKALDLAIRKNLFARAAKAPLRVAPDLAATLATLLNKRALQLIGQAMGAGAVVVGQPQVEEALATGRLLAVVVPAGAGRESVRKLRRARLERAGFSGEELGAALGRATLGPIGLRPQALSEKILALLAIWRQVVGDEAASATEDASDPENRDESESERS